MQINKNQTNINPSFKANLDTVGQLSDSIKALIPKFKENIQAGSVDAFIREHSDGQSGKIVNIKLCGLQGFKESFSISITDATVKKLTDGYFSLLDKYKQFFKAQYGDKIGNLFDDLHTKLI